jgi:tRNA pseudouridine55 synthase
MESLLRTRVGKFTLSDSMTLAQVEEAVREETIQDKIISIEEVLGEYPRVCCADFGDRLLRNGNPMKEELLISHPETPDLKDGWIRMCTSDGTFAGVYQWDQKRGQYFPVKMF